MPSKVTAGAYIFDFRGKLGGYLSVYIYIIIYCALLLKQAGGFSPAVIVMLPPSAFCPVVLMITIHHTLASVPWGRPVALV